MVARSTDYLRTKAVRIAEDLRNDLCYALRVSAKSPGFTLGSIAILAIAIGANTLLFTFFSAYLLKPLPLEDPQRNVDITAKQGRGYRFDLWSYADFSQLRAQNQAFEEMYATSPLEITVREPLPRKLKGVLASGNFFRIYNAKMILGRAFGPREDEALCRDAVVVLSNNAWRTIFNADPQITGKTIQIRQTAFTIIGVADPAFTGTDPITIPDLWAPVVMRDQLVSDGRRLADVENTCLILGGILKPGVSLAQAEDAMRGMIGGLNAQRPPAAAIRDIRLIGRATFIPINGEVLGAVVFIFSAFALLLLIACANLAGILLARGAARQREIAVRAALGASRARLIRQLLTECLLLCAMAAAPSLFLTHAGAVAIHRGISSLLIKEGFCMQAVSPDWRVFLFTAALVLSAGMFLGLVPALEASRADLAGSLKTGAGIRPNSRSQRIRGLFVTGQVAASLVLLLITGIFIRAAQRISRVDPGFDLDHVVSLRADGSKLKLIEQFREDPRFEASSEAYRAPLDAHGLRQLVAAAGGQTLDRTVGFNYVDSLYFETLGIPVRRGRKFTAPEARAQALVVVVSDATARLLWPQEDPIGKTVEVVDPSLIGLDSRAVRWSAGKYEVIGVVGDVVSGIWSGRRDRTAIYLPAAPGDPRNSALIVRIRDTSPATFAALKKICIDVDGVNASEPVTLREIATKLRLPFIVASAVSSLVGVLALIMTCIGLYGVVAFVTVQRTREIGIRIALGAPPLSVLRTVVTGSMLRVTLGIALGIPLCIVASKIVASTFFAIKPFDPVAYVTTPLFLASVTLAAAYVPARRATRIDPMTALRRE